MDYQPTVVQRHARLTKPRSPESGYWRTYKHPVFIKDFAPVTSIHFAPTAPHRYAVTAATRVQVYAYRTQRLTKTISRFQDVARSGNIRQDGKLVVAGDDTGLVQVFDINSRAVLRTMNEHRQPVHVTRFSALDSTQVLSCSDDTTVKLWDIPSQSSITTFTDHQDYVRSGLVSASNPSLILTGSYDSTVRVLDTRTGVSEMIMGSAEKGQAPVEDVLLFPSGTLALSCSGPILKVWDLVAGGRCLRALSNHQKTITCMAFDGKAARVLTGGLDQMVKVYDVATYQVVHTMRYPAPLLCLAVSPDDTHIAAGMSDGTLSVRRRDHTEAELSALDARKEAAKQGVWETLVDFEAIGEGTVKPKGANYEVLGDQNELRVEGRRRKRLRQYDKYLKSFRYRDALDEVLQPDIPPVTAFSLIYELIGRDGLRRALSGRDDILLEPIVKLLAKHITDVRFGELACEVAIVVLDMYASVVGLSPVIDAELAKLRSKVEDELKFQDELTQVRGAVEMILSTSVMAAT
ncbi:hypothetical protein FRB97_007515 [Tulasnella sp. 331]|nr:hypothetical protein FRB97_007515 [Tulasnella sp. 331]